jgi:RAB6A-GEF complex partner protein 1
MYWPISTPRIYATSSSRTPAIRLFESDDGLPSPSEVQSALSPSLNKPTSREAAGASDDNHDQPPPTPITPHTPAVQSVERDDELTADSFPGFDTTSSNQLPSKDPILALRISRAGHLFAVITSTSITLWQTKVNPLDPTQSVCRN